MFTNLSKIPIKLAILLVGVGLLVAGCDSSGPNADDQGQNDVEPEETIAFEAADWSDDRITRFNGSSSSSAKAAARKSTPGFTLNTHVEPPNVANVTDDVAASHLAVSELGNGDDMLYVGYKNVESDYGGGIDLLRDDGTLDEASGGGTDELQESEVDVQELVVKESGGTPNVLYVATAVDPDATVSQSPQFHSINLRSNGKSYSPVQFDAFDLDRGGNDGTGPAPTAAIAKSVTLRNGASDDVLVASDSNIAYQISTTSSGNDYDIDGTTSDNESGLSQLRNVTETPAGNVYALDFSGAIWGWSSGTWNNGPNINVTSGTLSNPGPSPGGAGENDGIARLTSHDFSSTNQGYGFKNDDLLFAAVNDAGFRVISPSDSPSGVRYSSRDHADNSTNVPEIYATSVAVTDNFVYVASGTTIAIYKIQSSGLDNTTSDDGLEYIGQQSFEDRAASVTDGAQINDIHVVPSGNNDGDGNILYVSKSTDGVFKLTQNSGAPYNN